MRRFLILLLMVAASIPSAQAVVVAGSTSPTYTQAPADDFGFSSVGIVVTPNIPASGVYLGDRWVISAYHCVSNGSGFVFNGVAFGGLGYTVDPTTATRLRNPDNTPADLAIFRLTEEPLVLAATLSGTTPIATTTVVMMGNGVDRSDTLRRWNVVGNSWEEVSNGGNRSGYDLVGTRAMRWGTNTVQPPNVLQLDGLYPVDGGSGVVRTFTLDWDNQVGEGMATSGDSGGGVFVKRGSEWQLAGILGITGGFANQPANTVVFENISYAADIATYKAQIEATMAAVPEPSAVMLLLSSLAFLPRRRARTP